MATPGTPQNQQNTPQSASPQSSAQPDAQGTQGRQRSGATQGTAQSGTQGQTPLRGDRQQQVPISREGSRVQGAGLSRRQPSGMALGGLEPFGTSFFSNPFALMRRISDEMDRIFQDFGVGRTSVSPWMGQGSDLWQGSSQTLWSPQVDVFERGNQLVIRADLPGLSREDVTIEAQDGALVISGERQQDQEQNQEGYYRSERSYGAFLRTIPLPQGVNAADAKATFRDGVLEVTLPKPEQQRGRRIDIQG